MKPLRHTARQVLTQDYFMNIKRFLKVNIEMFTLFSIEKHRDLNRIFQGKKYELNENQQFSINLKILVCIVYNLYSPHCFNLLCEFLMLIHLNTQSYFKIQFDIMEAIT